VAQRPCVCQGSNENCSHCFGRGFVEVRYKVQRSAIAAACNDEMAKEFLALHPRLHPNPLHQPEGTGAKYRPHVSQLTEEKSSEEPAPSSRSALPPRLRLTAKNRGRHSDLRETRAKTNVSRCPRCRAEFNYFIDLLAHQQAGCPKPKNPLAQPSVTTPRRLQAAPVCGQMTTCPDCRCPVKTVNLQKHAQRCPKKRRATSTNSPSYKGEGRGSALPAKRFHSAAAAKKIDPRVRFAQANSIERIDATKLYAHSFRENGKYGSHPLHDAMDDEAGPE
jgi:hypothetical protein